MSVIFWHGLFVKTFTISIVFSIKFCNILAWTDTSHSPSNFEGRLAASKAGMDLWRSNKVTQTVCVSWDLFLKRCPNMFTLCVFLKRGCRGPEILGRKWLC